MENNNLQNATKTENNQLAIPRAMPPIFYVREEVVAQITNLQAILDKMNEVGVVDKEVWKASKLEVSKNSTLNPIK
jgi:hypothetical protein